MLAGVVPALAFVSCAEGTKTVTVERHVTVETSPPPTTKEHHSSRQKAAPAKPKPAFVYCDLNIPGQGGHDHVSLRAEHLLDLLGRRRVSLASGVEPGGATDPHHDVREQRRPSHMQDQRRRRGQSSRRPPSTATRRVEADAYADGHDLGPDPYEGLPEEPGYVPPDDYEPEYTPSDDYEPEYTPSDDYDYDYTPPGENILNYDNGRGYRVQCADGTYSQSGGIQGACSHHGGVAD